MQFDIPQPTPIDGLTWTPKRVISDDRGAVLLMLKDDQFEFPVGEIYFSIVNPNIIKGWKLHTEMRQRFAVPIGDIQFVFVDTRPNSKSKGGVFSIELNDRNYGVLTLPAGIWYSFKGKGDSPALIVNAASISRKDRELLTKDLDSFVDYKWS